MRMIVTYNFNENWTWFLEQPMYDMQCNKYSSFKWEIENIVLGSK